MQPSVLAILGSGELATSTALCLAASLSSIQSIPFRICLLLRDGNVCSTMLDRQRFLAFRQRFSIPSSIELSVLPKSSLSNVLKQLKPTVLFDCTAPSDASSLEAFTQLRQEIIAAAEDAAVSQLVLPPGILSVEGKSDFESLSFADSQTNISTILSTARARTWATSGASRLNRIRNTNSSTNQSEFPWPIHWSLTLSKGSTSSLAIPILNNAWHVDSIDAKLWARFATLGRATRFASGLVSGLVGVDAAMTTRLIANMTDASRCLIESESPQLDTVARLITTNGVLDVGSTEYVAGRRVVEFGLRGKGVESVFKNPNRAQDFLMSLDGLASLHAASPTQHSAILSVLADVASERTRAGLTVAEYLLSDTLEFRPSESPGVRQLMTLAAQADQHVEQNTADLFLQKLKKL